MKSRIVDVNGFPIGGKRTYIIADVGSNHKQDLSIAKESIDAAVAAGVDAVKFQSIQLDELYFKPDANTSKFIKQLEFPEEWHAILGAYCKARNIVFFSSPTYMKAIDLLEEIDTPIYKLASAQIGTYPQIVEKVAALNKPTIFSTGISSYKEIIDAVSIFKKYKNDKYIILHCNSIYPTPADRVNMQLMNVYKSMFECPIGFSDHTIGTQISGSAVALGANVIEKHFTLDRSWNTPDSNEFACDPKELHQLVAEIRQIEDATRGFDDRMDIQNEELKFKESILYKLVANREIKKDQLIKLEDLDFKRASSGIDCRWFHKNNDLIAAQNISKGTLIESPMIKGLNGKN